MPRGKALKGLELIRVSREILAQIQPCSVRAVCYQLFNRGLLANMGKNETNRAGRELVYAREQGIIPWEWIVDETREAETIASWTDPSEYADVVQRAYRKDRWVRQPNLVEVWSEKGTVRGTIAPVLNAFQVTFRVMHGYASATAIHEVAEATKDNDQRLVVIYVGDWDPSGMHMSEVDVPGRLEEYGAEGFLVRRVALNERDVVSGGLPSFPTDSKRGDPRHGWYARNYGAHCWELDALNPVALRQRLNDVIHAHLDLDEWQRAQKVEDVERATIMDVVGTWREALASAR